MYLNVTTISDVTLADGKTLDRHMFHGTRSLVSSTSKQMPINQERLGKISWRLWRKALSIWATDNILKQPLGVWYKYGNEIDRIWPSYYDFIDRHLYVKSSDKFIQYSKNCKNEFVNGVHISWSPSESSAPVHVVSDDGATPWYDLYCHGVVGELIPPPISTFESYIDSTDSWEMEILQDVDMVYSCYEISEMLEGDYIHLASD